MVFAFGTELRCVSRNLPRGTACPSVSLGYGFIGRSFHSRLSWFAADGRRSYEIASSLLLHMTTVHWQLAAFNDPKVLRIGEMFESTVEFSSRPPRRFSFIFIDMMAKSLYVNYFQ